MRARFVILATALLLGVLACLFARSDAAYCHGQPDPNAPPNLNPIFSLPPVFVDSTKNGKLYVAGQKEDQIFLLHVWGTPYEMGFAHGTLLKKELQTLWPTLWKYLESQVEDILKSLPEWLAKILAQEGLAVTLDLTWEITKAYSGNYFFEELQGIADASGVDYKMLRRIHMIGELTKGACSMFGAWGNATATIGGTIQLRALDWDVKGPFKNFPLVTVYHPTRDSNNGRAFANVGFVGWVGSITGVSESQVAISEIGVSYPDETFGQESRFGVPFTFLLRDIIQFDYTLDDAISRMAGAHRTCNLILGVGDGKLGEFRAFQYGHSVLHVVDDKNLLPDNSTWHFKIPQVVYYGMDWLCPGYSLTLGTQLRKFWGKITIENTIQEIVARTQTGNLQICVYDLTNQFIYVAYARADNETGPAYAYERQFVKFDLRQLFSETAP